MNTELTNAEAMTRPQRWVAEKGGRSWCVVRADHSEYHRSQPCNYGPRGRIISFKHQTHAESRANSLNLVDVKASRSELS